MRNYEKWKHTDADFTLQELADTLAWLIESDSDFDPTDTELLATRGV